MALSNLISPETRDGQRHGVISPSSSMVDFTADFENPESRENRSASALKLSSWVSRQLMDIEILYILNFGPKTGYELKKKLREMFNADISFGTVYPHLRALQKLGLIEEIVQKDSSESSLKKVTYSNTPSGALTLRQSIASIGKIGLSMHFTVNKLDFQHDGQEQIKSKDRISTIHTLQAILERRGYTVMRDISFRGFSGSEYKFEMLATKSIGRKQKDKILVQLVDERMGSQMGLDRAMKLLVTGQDIGARILLLAIPHLNVEVSDFFNFHGMPIFEGESWQTVLSDFTLQFEKSLQ